MNRWPTRIRSTRLKDEAIPVKTRLTFYRDSELAGCRLLNLMMRVMTRSDEQAMITHQLAEEYGHASLWTREMEDREISCASFSTGYQTHIGKSIRFTKEPGALLALTYLIETRAHFVYEAHLKWEKDNSIRNILTKLVFEEDRHLDWIGEMGFRYGERYRDALDRYAVLEENVYKETMKGFYAEVAD